MRTALYARYSDDRQNDRSIADQFRVCRQRAELRGWAVVATFSDAAISGQAMANRPGMQNLLAMAESGAIDIVLVEDEDRLARVEEHGHHIKGRLDDVGVILATLTNDAVDDITFTIKNLFAARYSKNLGAKTKRGMQGNFEKGLAISGRQYGYDTRPGGEIWIDAAQAGVVRRIFALYAEGLTTRDIAGRLNADAVPGPRGGAWNGSTIGGNARRANGILRCELYAGVRLYGRVHKRIDRNTGRHVDTVRPQADWQRLAVPHLRIVDQDLWEKVAARLAQRSTPLSSSEGEVPSVSAQKNGQYARRKVGVFSGLFKCGQCGASYTAKGEGRLGCAGFMEKGRAFCANNRSVARAQMERRVLTGLSTRLLAPEVAQAYIDAYHRHWARLRSQARSDSGKIEARLAEIGRRSRRIIEAIETGVSTPALNAQLVAMEAERQDLEVRLGQTTGGAPVVEFHPGAARAYARTIENLQARLAAIAAGQRTDADQRLVDAARGLIEKVVITPEGSGIGGPVDLVLHGKLALLLNDPRTGQPPAWGGMVVAGGSVSHAPLSVVQIWLPRVA